MALASVKLNYKPAKFELFNDGHSISIKPVDESNFVVFNNQKYILKDIRINFKANRPVEIDFIHYSPQEPEGRDLLVIRVPLKIVPDAKINKTLDRIISILSPRINDKKLIELNPKSLLPVANLTEDNFDLVPSLTIITPLPDEAIGVVLHASIEMSPKQKEELVNKFNDRFANTPQF
jgi:carbonic anhydrase